MKFYPAVGGCTVFDHGLFPKGTGVRSREFVLFSGAYGAPDAPGRPEPQDAPSPCFPDRAPVFHQDSAAAYSDGTRRLT